MVNGQLLRAQKWESAESVHSDASCSLLKGQTSPNTSEWTVPSTCKEGLDIDALQDSTSQAYSNECSGHSTADADTDALNESKRNVETAPAYRLIVDTDAPFKIREACAGWFGLFQFRQSDVVGRSFRMCQGPKTDAKKLKDLIKGAGDLAQMETVLYSKDGDEISVAVRASSADTPGMNCCQLTMALSGHSSDGSDEEKERAVQSAVAETADFVLTTEEEKLFQVKHVTASFLKLCGYPETLLREEGIAMMIGPRADGIKFKNLLRHGMEGMERETHLTIVSVDGEEVPVRMRVMPQKEEASQGAEKTKITELAFVCVFEERTKTQPDVSSSGQDSSPETSSSSF
eukprot:544617-Rhodomonas_salina.2